jgi:hypothetical protein
MEIKNETVAACVSDCGGYGAAFHRTFYSLTPSGKRFDYQNVRLLPPLLGERAGVRASSFMAESARLLFLFIFPRKS